MSKNRAKTSLVPPVNRLGVSLKSPGPLTTRYFDDTIIELKVDNLSGETLFIESLTLRFEPDTGATPVYLDLQVGQRIIPGRSATLDVAVRPTPLFREYTNQFVARFKCHCESGGRIFDGFMESHDGLYIIIHPREQQLGDVFVSFKQPEDQRLANILERYARRAGFTPHMFMRNPHLGADQWKLIEASIKEAHSAFIVWALRTDWGQGVGKEIELCRKHKVREVLLIEEGIELPAPYKGTQRAYRRFDPTDPASALSEAVSSVYAQVTGARR